MVEYYVFGFEFVDVDCDYVECVDVWCVVVGVDVGVWECDVILCLDYW